MNHATCGPVYSFGQMIHNNVAQIWLVKSGNSLEPLLYFLCLVKNFLLEVNILRNTIVIVKKAFCYIQVRRSIQKHQRGRQIYIRNICENKFLPPSGRKKFIVICQSLIDWLIPLENSAISESQHWKVNSAVVVVKLVTEQGNLCCWSL